MTMMLMDGDDSYEMPMMADDEVLVVVSVPPRANQDKQSPCCCCFKPLHRHKCAQCAKCALHIHVDVARRQDVHNRHQALHEH